jgi:hypothetical protein
MVYKHKRSRAPNCIGTRGNECKIIILIYPVIQTQTAHMCANSKKPFGTRVRTLQPRFGQRYSYFAESALTNRSAAEFMQ